MRHSFFLKTISAFGLMAAASVAMYSNDKQYVQARNQDDVEIETLSVGNCIEALVPEGELFHEFQGIELTPEQEAAYQQAEEELSARSALMDVQTEVMPNGINIIAKDGVHIPDDVLQQIFSVSDAANLDQVPDSEQIDELNAEYGQYVEFVLSERLRLTPEQVAENQAIDREFESKILSVLTPEQQQVYLRNLETKHALAACDPDPSDG
ncbi:hypothetical protein D0962_32980 [Leptolyngbyaceae cyanobacterium CCMR0082]|uniref:Uncharacterized protein n=1 Tax=Adonisia turfae CCMR0082 TaxID=2304604 RepID=A0A6M0SG20_9CYAN|nr:hypothetical protein [Adonisia turfae]NEZ67520.1 hypothetical protein [Adonisia turfae CCMR0082]